MYSNLSVRFVGYLFTNFVKILYENYCAVLCTSHVRIGETLMHRLLVSFEKDPCLHCETLHKARDGFVRLVGGSTIASKKAHFLCSINHYVIIINPTITI